MDRDSGSRGPLTAAIILALAGLAVAVGAWYYFNEMRSIREMPPPPPPSTEWTTAPEGGVEVDLPDVSGHKEIEWRTAGIFWDFPG